MFPNQQVTQLRKEGKLAEAYRVGYEALLHNPDDKYLKSAIAWVHYAYIKQAVEQLHALMKGNNPNTHKKSELTNFVRQQARQYAKLNLSHPSMEYSNIVRVLTEVGRSLSYYVDLIAWGGESSFSKEDYQPYRSDQGTSSSLLTKVAREAFAWRQQPGCTDQHDAFILQMLNNAMDNAAEDPSQKIWIYLDRARLHKSRGSLEQAAHDMRKVLRGKSGEFWAWRDMAEIQHASHNIKMAIACYCQALLCRTKPDFTVKVHIALGDLLQQQAQTPEAIAEFLAAADLYQQNGWNFPDELQGTMQAPWFAPDLAAPNMPAFYQQQASQAQHLCYNNVRVLPATYLTTFTDKNKRQHALFAISEGKEAKQLITQPKWGKNDQPASGAGFQLTLGGDQRGESVLALKARSEAELWDQIIRQSGVIENISKDRSRGGVYLTQSRHVAVVITEDLKRYPQLNVGQPVEIWVARNIIKDRLEGWHLMPTDTMPQSDNIKTLQGELHVHEKGFAFVEDVFVRRPLVKKEWDSQQVEVLCIYQFNEKKREYGWQAIKVIHPSSTGC